MFLRFIILVSCVFPCVNSSENKAERQGDCCEPAVICVQRCVQRPKVLQRVKSRIECKRQARCKVRCKCKVQATKVPTVAEPCDSKNPPKVSKETTMTIEQVPYEIKESSSINVGGDLILVPLEESVDIKTKEETAAGTPVAALRGPLSIINDATVRVTVGNVCGSGTIVGRNSQGQALVLTNAHVAGTKRCRVVDVQRWTMAGSSEKGKSTIIAAGYKRGSSLDYALLKCEQNFATDVVPIPLAQRYPDKDNSITSSGCPRCEWPSLQVLRMIEDSGQVLSWKPEAISGRSGSGVVEHTPEGPRVVGLLTWAGNGNGLGQSTLLILDALYGTVPKSLQALPDGVREIAFIKQQENKELVSDIVESDNTEVSDSVAIDDEAADQKKGIFRNRRNNDDDGNTYPGPIRRGFDFLRRLILTTVLCLIAFAVGFVVGKLKG